MSNIAGKALSLLGSPEAWAGAGAIQAHGRAKVIPLHLASSVAMSLLGLALLMSVGLALSSALPAAAAIFAVALTLCLVWRELKPRRAPKPSHPAAPNNCTHESDALDVVPGLITRHDGAGHILAAGGSDCRAFGFSVARLEPSAYLDAVHVGGRIAFLSAVDELRQGAPRAAAEFLFACSATESGYRPVRAVLVPLKRVDGQFSGFSAQTLDITEETILRDEVLGWKSEALSANDAKTRFLAAVSHELRTPLNAILGFSDILIGEYFGRLENERQREYVRLINQSGHHLLAVVNAMLDMSRIEAGRFELVREPFHIADAIRTVDEMLALQAKSKGVVMTTRVARGMEEVVADRRAIQQILINLANNAIKFTGEGGVVAIDAACDVRNLTISVSDTGIGIPADKLALIGRPFVQVQNDYARRYEGTGLGLALVKGLVGLHGGTFSVESEPGVGTVVTITVPMDGEGDAGAETFEFPPRLKEKTFDNKMGENKTADDRTGGNRHGTAEAKIA